MTNPGNLISIIQTASVVGMTFCGYHYYPHIKRLLNTDTIKPIKDSLFEFKENTYITEDNFCKILGSLTGTMIGRLFYPVGIPYTLYFIDRHYGDQIKKYLKKK